jgi:hypothetical protein
MSVSGPIMIPALPSHHSPETGQKTYSVIAHNLSNGVLVTRSHLHPPIHGIHRLLPTSQCSAPECYRTCWSHRTTTTCRSEVRRYSLDRNANAMCEQTGIFQLPGMITQPYIYSSKHPGGTKASYSCTNSLTNGYVNTSPCSRRDSFELSNPPTIYYNI